MPEVKVEEGIENRCPQMPWKMGVFPDYRAFSIVVEVCQSEEGHVFSTHKMLTKEDEKTCASFPSGGVEQIAFGLLMEAVRREAYIAALIRLTNNPLFLKEFSQSTNEEKAALALKLSKETTDILHKNIGTMVLPSVQEIMEMLTNQLSPTPSNPV